MEINPTAVAIWHQRDTPDMKYLKLSANLTIFDKDVILH